jgi:hypothetical protein
MAEINLKKLSRAELLEMMISFSEEAEAAKRHEQELKDELEREKLQLQKDMAKERAMMLKNFDEEKAEMRIKFNEQKAVMQAKFDKDISGLKARLDRERSDLLNKVDDEMGKIQSSGTLAEASIKLGGIMEAGQKAADIYVQTVQNQAKKEYEDFKKQMVESQKKIAYMEAEAKKRCEEMIRQAQEKADAIYKEQAVKGETSREETSKAKASKEETSKETPTNTTEEKTTEVKTATNDSATEEVVTPAPKKRGRPRKVKVEDEQE